MAHPKNTIQINGRTYDARTGALLSNSKSTQTSQVNGASLDGVQRRKAPQPVPKIAAAKPTQVPVQQRQRSASPSRALDIKPVPKKTQRAQTLKRTAVKKPVKTPPQATSISSPVTASVERSATGRGFLMKRVPDARVARAKIIAKSQAVSKFGHNTAGHGKLTPQTTNAAPVKAPPIAHAKPAPAITKPNLAPESMKKEVFSHSIAHATHHDLPKVQKPDIKTRIARTVRINPRISGAIAACLAIVLLGGFLAYQNVPSVAMRVAASQAGFNGKLPNSTPAGFAFKGPIDYEKGRIIVSYKSNSDERGFSITQKPTNWNSESLLANHLLSSKTRYQTYYDKGLTVYIYGGGNATWVSKGVWYTVSGKGSLSSEQILAIASSM